MHNFTGNISRTRRSARAPQSGATRNCLESLDIYQELRPFARHRQSTSNLISIFSLLDFEIIS